MPDDDDSPARLILIVAGSTLRAEELDRPLAYYLRQQVEGQLTQRRTDGRDETPARVLVVADFRFLNDKPLQSLAAISVGGPGVNALAHAWFEELPFTFAVDEQFCIQMDPDLVEPRASIWGMDNASTQIAVSMFVERYLPKFLDRACRDARRDRVGGRGRRRDGVRRRRRGLTGRAGCVGYLDLRASLAGPLAPLRGRVRVGSVHGTTTPRGGTTNVPASSRSFCVRPSPHLYPPPVKGGRVPVGRSVAPC